MAWIKFEKDLLTDPRVLRMAKRLHDTYLLADTASWASEKCNGHALPAVTLVCGGLVRIWSLADTHVDVNDVIPLGFDEINKLIGIPGFCELMPVDWIERIDDDSVKLPNYHTHNGTEAKRKAVTQKRVAAFRTRNGQALPDQTKTRPRPDTTNGSRKNGAHHALPDDSPILEKLPLRDGSEFPVKQSLVKELEPIYPAVDIPATLKEMRGWLLLNADRRKTRAGVRRFIGNWLQSEQAKHGS